MTGPVLLYDGSCGLCAASVQLILRNERLNTLRFAPLEGTYAATVKARHPELAGVNSMVWVEPAAGRAPESVLVRSTAALRVAGYLGGLWRMIGLGRLLPRPLRDAVYDVVATHRHRFGGADQCYLPPPEVRARFLE